jgi:CRP/FNR family transcriptional regulator
MSRVAAEAGSGPVTVSSEGDMGGGGHEISARILASNELLFETGDLKSDLYRIDSGAICLYTTGPDGKSDVIEFAFAGDIVGMGFLPTHVCNARAVAETWVTCLPRNALDSISPDDQRTNKRLNAAIIREFEYRRETLAAQGKGRPVARLAALLVALSRRNRGEGRDPYLIDDVPNSAIVADYLGLSIDLLALALVQLQNQRLIELTAQNALYLRDVEALAALSESGGPAGALADNTNQRQLSF